MFYLYGVTRPGVGAPAERGVGTPPRPVRVVGTDRLSALVSELPDGYVVREEDARAHLHVLIEALRDGPVVPLRLGTVTDDEDAARSMLADSADDLTETLDALDGRVELHVDADDDVAEVLALVGRSAPGLAASESDDLAARIDVGQRIAELVVDHRRRMADQILDRLRRLSVDDVPRAQIRGPEDPVLRWAFLVRQEDLELFDEAIVALRAELPSLAFRYVGPLPAAHFVGREPVPSAEPADSFRGNGSWGW
jgi:hypothetical protein